MAESYQDAMSIFRKYGKPDLFTTFTCNTHWPEITCQLLHGQIPDDRPDLISREFHQFLQEFIKDFNNRYIFGKVTAYVFVVEFQKRGYPHCHILIYLSDEDKLTTPEHIDALISAEIPDPKEQPELLVKKFMVHGPCPNRDCPCMHNNQCSKKIPKTFPESTVITGRGYPTYKRPTSYRQGSQLR